MSDTDDQSSPWPSQRHYLRRRGRMTAGQERALTEQAHRVRFQGDAMAGEHLAPPPNWTEEFSTNPSAALGLEIGFGMGQSLVHWAQENPELNLVGIEVYQPGIGSALLQAEAADVLSRLFVIEADARLALEMAFAPRSLQEIRVFFPDPWPKARHHKRRLLQRDFAELMASRLKVGGELHIATDWEDYAFWILESLDLASGLRNVAGAGQFGPRYAPRPVTRFESRGQRLGHDVWDLHYEAVE